LPCSARDTTPSTRLAKVVFDNTAEGIMVTDLDNRVLMVNRGFEALTGFAAADVVGRPHDILANRAEDPTLDAQQQLVNLFHCQLSN
jgi:PAS domain S-box-containing protein